MKEIFSLIFGWAMVLGTISAQTTTIPDANFEQKLVNLGIDSDGLVNGQILNSDAAAVTKLSVQSSNIYDLTGIAAFTNLDTLYCQSNNMTSLSVSNNTNLLYLHCSHNDLTSLSVGINPSLKHISCHYNQLTSLNISFCPALEELRANNNQLTSINLSSNVNLIDAGLGDNQLTSLDVTANTALVELSFYKNQISTIDLSFNLALEQVIGGYNPLPSIDLSNNPLLDYLSLFYVEMPSIDLSNNPLLTYVRMGFGELTSIDLSNNPNLETLYLQDNQLVELDVSGCPLLDRLECYNNQLTALNLYHNPLLDYLSCFRNQLYHLDVSRSLMLTTLSAVNNPAYLQICVANLDTANSRSFWYKDTPAKYTEGCYRVAVEGRVTVDANNDCIVNTTEKGLKGERVKFQKGNEILYFNTYDTLGNYIAYLDTGVYTATVIPSGPYWQVCPNSQTIVGDTNYIVQTMDWGLQPSIFCPLLNVDVSALFLRTTGGGSNYVVSYCNNGSMVAANAYVEVDLDADLDFISSSVPIASQNGSTYTFNIGNVAVGQCGSFNINVVVSTNAINRQTHCTEAHIYPDTVCIPIWTGAILKATVACQIDTVVFGLENKGASMLQGHQYFVFEDDLIMRSGNVQLLATQSTSISQFAAPGKTYRIEIAQEAGFPSLLGDSVAMASVEGCNPLSNGTFSVGFMTQFSNGNSSPFVAVDCQQNVASYDPNDKAAQPAGYGAAHYIYKNTAIDYKVRFQNTGTDTAFNIVILDTLSAHVDIASLTMGASSHNYTWTIQDGNVLRVNFYNVMLPDSNVNEPLSNGFFRYRIEQQPNNPNGTVIENTAAIYFDYNPAIFTNTTFHTIGENFVSVNIITSAAETLAENVAVKVYPNPFKEQATLEVEGGNYQELKLKIYDTMGRYRLQSVSTEDNKIQIQRGNLPQGVYIYRLEGDGELINTGKIIIQ